ncbi:hypothetical protein ART_3095 [Arthrobacter sp. PAMC 25486]|uniref:family 78 glycoside hydrolase catalytic domain n=1 Tax=Arthrobacter sp. PAMC 25486 TaxID=1494608 RepID=UPI000535A801|nr:family 78 glycoside hydrolase catalytic domain [Arthrobacter sp. PAMC 25486]AIY02694.1 hypothetical protein ART_3095 [Arthrobacter sp. PAMC 25486]
MPSEAKKISPLAYADTISPAPTKLRIDDRFATVDIPGIALPLATTPHPRISWVVPLVRPGQEQAAYQINVSRDSDPRVHGDVWSSGIISSTSNSDIPWGGRPLQSFERVRLSVRVTDEHGQLSLWSEPVVVETGPLQAEAWAADWITFPTTHAACTDFHLPPGQKVRRAVLHLAGHGVAVAALDGNRINADARDFCDTSLKRSTARAYDVTSALTEHTTHRLSIVATLGHYRIVLEQPRVLVELVVDLEDGTVFRVGSSNEWHHAPTSLVADQPFYVEDHDARRTDDWLHQHHSLEQLPHVDALDASSVPASATTVTPEAGPPIRIVRSLKAQELPTVDGMRVYDVGENISGRMAALVRGVTAGVRVEVIHGEKLNTRGVVDTTNIRLPDDVERERQVLAWTCAGAAAGDVETITPWFASYGFRYVGIRGLPLDAEVSVTAGVLHSDVERTGQLRTNVAQIDSLVDMAARSQLNNSVGFPSDCPTREQSGWTGDAAISAEAALSHLGLEGMYRNWLVDVALDAMPNGAVRGVAPHLLGEKLVQPGDPVWGAALVEIPWQLWWATGNLSTIIEILPAMRTWADWQVGTLEDGVVRHSDISYGADWLAFEQTPPVLLQTAAVATSLRQLADLEGALGMYTEEARRREQAASVIAAARNFMRDPSNGQWANDSQASSALAVSSGLAPAADHVFLADRIQRDVATRGNRLASGFSGTQAVVRTLAAADGGTALLDAVLQDEQPGIGSMLVDGPGTFWETWWIDNQNVGVASLDHVALGAPFAAWAWSHVAGLRALEPGFRRFAIAPRLADLVTEASFERDTVRGCIAAAWSYTAADRTFRCTLTVPVGSMCELHVPNGETLEFGSGTHTFERTDVVMPERSKAAPRDVPAAPPGGRWLSDGVESSWQESPTAERAPAGEVTAEALLLRTLDTDVICAPVYHEPIAAPTLEITIPRFHPDVARWITMDQSAPLDLSAARFVFAHFDVDGPGLAGRALRPLLRLTSTNGTFICAEARPLPIAWNRVAIDVDHWPGRASVTAIEVGIQWSDNHDWGRGPYVELPSSSEPFTFTVGRVGWSSAPRTF